MVDEGKKDACYHKVKSRYSVWPSAYASGALVKCRKKGAANWGNKTKKESYEISNWRDDFQALEYESIDIIKAEPLKPTNGIDSRMVDESSLRKPVPMPEYKPKGTKKPVPMPKYKLKGTEKPVPMPNYPLPLNQSFEQDGEVLDEVKSKQDKLKEISKQLVGASKMHAKQSKQVAKVAANLDEKCWKGYKKKGMKTMFGKRYPNCVKAHFSDWREDMELQEDWQKSNRKDGVDGMSQKSVNAYKRENPGSKLKTAVTGKVKKGSKDAKRRSSYCSRSKGQMKMHNIDCSKTPEKKICKARKRWRC
jgi:hypothetical protein